MGGKKAPAKKAAAGGEGDEDPAIVVQKFWKYYRANVKELGFEKPSPQIKDLIMKFEEDEELPKKFHLWDELGWAGVKAITDALNQAK